MVGGCGNKSRGNMRGVRLRGMEEVGGWLDKFE